MAFSRAVWRLAGDFHGREHFLLDLGLDVVVAFIIDVKAVSRGNALRRLLLPLHQAQRDQVAEVCASRALLRRQQTLALLVLDSVVAGETPFVLAKVLDDSLLLRRVEQRLGPRPPLKLVKVLVRPLVVQRALEVPKLVAVVHLELEERALQRLQHARRDDAPARVPLDVRAAVVLYDLGPLVVKIVKLQDAVVRVPDAREHDVAARRGPEQGVAAARFQRHKMSQLLLLAVRPKHGVERDVGLGVLAVDDREAVARRLPGKGVDDVLALHLEHLHGDERFVHPEKFKRVEERLPRLGVPEDLDADVLALGLPGDAAV
mmetsp:Transcript_28854/g.97262  ORF Transcript_28854/g.97262 Transcript_28854/m.97262 type:complete len:318 (+) Transcript_28854:36-989(+)